MTDKLKSLLANLFILYFGARNAHWNIQGENFNELHEFFADLYGDVEDKADLVAERIRQLGEFSPGCMSAILEYKTAEETGNILSSQGEAMTTLLNVTEQVIATIKEAIPEADQNMDYATNNMLMTMIEQMAVWQWKLRSYTM